MLNKCAVVVVLLLVVAVFVVAVVVWYLATSSMLAGIYFVVRNEIMFQFEDCCVWYWLVTRHGLDSTTTCRLHILIY